jgi:hypothetical protein
MKVENYHLHASNGKHIRIATKVILEDGREIRFLERLSKKQAIRSAQFEISRSYFA